MKLYSVHLWSDYFEHGEEIREERSVLVFAENEFEAESKALDNDFLEAAEVEKEVTEIDGYKIILERIDSNENNSSSC